MTLELLLLCVHVGLLLSVLVVLLANHLLRIWVLLRILYCVRLDILLLLLLILLRIDVSLLRVGVHAETKTLNPLRQSLVVSRLELALISHEIAYPLLV